MTKWTASLALALSLLSPAIPTFSAQSPDKEKKPDSAEEKKSDAPKEKTFEETVKDAKVIKGLFTLYQTDEKVFLEIQPNQLDKMYILSLTCESGLGEGGFYGAEMCGQTPVTFHKEGKTIQLIAKNTRFFAKEGLPIQRAVNRSFSDSVLGSSKLASLPQPQRQSLLVDFGDFLLTDVPMYGYALELSFRFPYRFDPKNSYFGTLKSFEKNVEIETVAHYAIERPPLPPLVPPGTPLPPMPPPPRDLPDVRSLLVRFHYSFSELPPPGFRPRLADDRIGHFFTQVEDFSADTNFEASKRYINHWRLEKLDPSAPLSPPKQPIVFWLENTIPVQYRDAIREGILLWNNAFERIGFQNAVVVKQQPDDADWDPADVRYSTIRWFTGYPEPGFAEGPSAVNPLTGEVFDADIRFDAGLTRFFRREKAEYIKPTGDSLLNLNPPMRPFLVPWHNGSTQFCDLLHGSALDAEFSFDLLVARGMDPDGPDADQFIHDYLVEIAAHEVGRTLGLRHNFRASTYWAIEYAYKPIDAPSPEGELPQLEKIASRSAEPDLAFDTDEDAGIGGGAFDMDPLVNRFDYGTDPLQFYARRVVLAHEVWDNMQKRLEVQGGGYQVLRRSFDIALAQAGYSLYLSSKYIGGVYHYRGHVGDPGNRLPFEPVPAAQQKAALEILRKELFSPTSFQFSPELLNKLASSRFSDWTDIDSMRTRFDVPIHEMVFGLQNRVLDRLYDPIVLNRLLDSEVKVSSSSDALTVGLLFNEIQDSIWAELKTPGPSVEINSYRRSLQRAHLRKLVAIALRTDSVPEDAQTMARENLTALRSQIRSVAGKPGFKMSLETRAHLNESLNRIDDTLKANMQRTAF